jgi:alkylhydroperoxidase/carboxymuconolactone decarboxylase family protein YurZ
MSSEQKPTIEQVFGMMRKTMGSIPSAIEKAAAVDESLLYEHLRSRAYAMPPEGALDEETRTLIYLASALAAPSRRNDGSHVLFRTHRHRQPRA